MRAAVTAAFAFGFNAGAPPQKQAAVTFADVPTFDAAINALVSKKVVSRAAVDAMDEKAKSRAFYVSRLAEMEAVERVKQYLVENLKDKTSFQNFVKNLDKDELLKKAGWEKDGGWYWETVYRTNTMSAFNAGRAEAFDEYEPEFLEFIGIEDFRQTPVCASRSGIVKKRTDPFWKKNFPPLHFNCRSTVRPVYAEEAEAFGIKESENVSLPDAPAKGFGRNPAAEWDEVTEGVKERWIDLSSGKSSKLGLKQGVKNKDLREIKQTLLPDDGFVKRIMIDDNMRKTIDGSFLDGTVRLNGMSNTPALLKSAVNKIKNKQATKLNANEYEAMITLYHEYTHGKFPIDNETWRNLSNNAKNKIEILTELYARTKIALRDEVNNDVLRKSIIVNSTGYSDLIEKKFLEESGLEFDKTTTEKFNKVIEVDLKELIENPDLPFSNIRRFNNRLGLELILRAAGSK